jgi:hypothetical protein
MGLRTLPMRPLRRPLASPLPTLTADRESSVPPVAYGRVTA